MCTMKICYVVTIPGTIESFFLPQLKYLSNQEFDITVICNDSDEIRNELGDTINFIPVDMPRGISLIGSIKAMYQLCKIFKKEKYDLVQYSTPNAAFYSSIASKIAKIKIRNYHCMGFRYLGFSGIIKMIFKLIEKITCLLSTHIECVSQSNLDLAIDEKLFLKEKGTVIFHGSTGGVDLQKFNIKNRNRWRVEIREKYGIVEEDFVYGFVGRITRDKGVNELLEAYFNINNNSKLLLIGNIEENNDLNYALLSKVKENENIIFVGSVTDVEKYFAAIDVLVLPTYREGFGNVIIESNAMGTPVIVSDIPGPRDAIEENINGFLVKPRDTQDLCNKMIQIKNNYISQNYIDRCHTFVKNKFDSELLCEQIYLRKKRLLNDE